MVNVIGLGYIGLPCALMLAANGVAVTGTDINTSLVDNLTSGDIRFDEEELSSVYRKALSMEISFTTEYIKADYYIIAVPTPYKNKSKEIDASFVEAAVKSVLSVCDDNATIIIESTVSPCTIDKYIRPLIGERTVRLAHAPERIIPGNTVQELINNARIIGADEREIAEDVAKLYRSFVKGEITLTDIKTAEITKVVENTFRAVNIAFANELLKVCEAAGVDVYEVIDIANKHPRVNILKPGPGVGGHCIGVDPWFLVSEYPEDTPLIATAMQVNESMPKLVLKRITEIMKTHNIDDTSKVGLYGLTYKENVSDIRQSPTLRLLELATEQGLSDFICYDPYVSEDVVPNQLHSFEEFESRAELIVIMVSHDEIINKKDLLKKKCVLDTRNMLRNGSCYVL